MEEIKAKRAISLAEVKEILSKSDPESMDQIQNWTHDYASKFVRIEADVARKMHDEMVKDCGLTDEEAIEIINILPTSMPELRSFTFGWKKLVLTETLQKILSIIKEHA